MGIKEELIATVGPGNVSDDPKVLRSYARDNSLLQPRMPAYVVKPKTAEDVQKIVSLSNQNRIPVYPCSSGIHFYGNTIPSQGGITLDLSRMNDILGVDSRNRAVRFEPGVTWGQLSNELDKHGLIPLTPLLPHPGKSALSSQLEREPLVATKFEYAEPVFTMEVVLPTGERFRTGSASVPGFPGKSASDGVYPEGPGMDWYRLFLGAQGTMGVVTWINSRVEPKPKANKTFFLTFDRIEEAIGPLYRIQKRMVGQECLLLNKANLETILRGLRPDISDKIKGQISPWTVILVLSGGWRRPEEKIAYEEAALMEVLQGLGVSPPKTSLPGLPGWEHDIPRILRNPWPDPKTYWKFIPRGASQDLFFLTVMSKVPSFTSAISLTLGEYGLSMDDVGIYVQPMERGRACHYECNIFYNPDVPGDVSRVRELDERLGERCIHMGALFTIPHGPIVDMVYSRAASYTATLKKVKGLLDPNQILSPGRLCF